jgi:hypothetical protein
LSSCNATSLSLSLSFADTRHVELSVAVVALTIETTTGAAVPLVPPVDADVALPSTMAHCGALVTRRSKPSAHAVCPLVALPSAHAQPHTHRHRSATAAARRLHARAARQRAHADQKK